MVCVSAEAVREAVKESSIGRAAVGAVYYLRLRAAALALRGPPAMSQARDRGRS